ncbi:hypothetical protein FCV25MIE_33658 [Fagus crenata]
MEEHMEQMADLVLFQLWVLCSRRGGEKVDLGGVACFAYGDMDHEGLVMLTNVRLSITTLTGSRPSNPSAA